MNVVASGISGSGMEQLGRFMMSPTSMEFGFESCVFTVRTAVKVVLLACVLGQLLV